MPITFTPNCGQILMCNFDDQGFIRPEMQKIRHCVVISPRYRRHTGCCVIVPLSTVAPNPVELYHYRIPHGAYQCLDCGADSWAKGDMVTHAAFARLDRPRENHRFASIFLKAEDLCAIKKAVLHALGLSNLVQHF